MVLYLYLKNDCMGSNFLMLANILNNRKVIQFLLVVYFYLLLEINELMLMKILYKKT